VELAARGGIVSSIARVIEGATRGRAASPQERREGYAFCSDDSFWFRPAYTEGKCPLCGKVAPGGAPPLPLVRRMDRSWFGLAGLALESLVMLVLVLFMFFR
jgi:hypothetical protein